jgi:hypothetical protein
MREGGKTLKTVCARACVEQSSHTHMQGVGTRVVHHGQDIDHILQLLDGLRRLFLASIPDHHRHSTHGIQVGGAHREALYVEPTGTEQPTDLVQHPRVIVHQQR